MRLLSVHHKTGHNLYETSLVKRMLDFVYILAHYHIDI